MNINESQITDIIKKKYPIECNILQREGYNLARLFTDDFNNYIVIENDDDDDTITVTFLSIELCSIDEVFERKNEGSFFIVEDINDLKKLIDMNLVFYQDYNLEKIDMDNFEKNLKSKYPMEKKFNGDRNKFSKEDLKMFDDIAKLGINYCNCYPSDKTHPDYAFCDKCEMVVPGTDESIVRQVVALTGQFKFLKSK